jgi:hypothetical protein
MARRPDDVTILLRMSKTERERINRALGRGSVNAIAVQLLLDEAESRLAAQPALDQLALDDEGVISAA